MVSTSNEPASAEVRIEITGNQAKLLVDGRVMDTRPESFKLLRKLYREVVRRYIDIHPDLIWLHAGSATSDSGALVLPGSWGRGKSSLILELVRRGWSFMSDDVVPLDPFSGVVLPFPATPHVRNKTDKELSRDRLGEIEKSVVPLDADTVADGPVPLSMIVMPHYEKGAETELQPLRPAEAVGELLENCLSFAKNEDATIRQLCTLVETLPVFRIRFDDFAEATDVLIGAYRAGARSAHSVELEN